MIRILVVPLLFLSLQAAHASDAAIKITTWNVGAAWDGAIEARTTDFRDAHRAIGADVYVLQEVSSLAGVREIASAMVIGDASLAVTDFASPRDQEDGTDAANVFFHLEIVIVSTRPILSVTELEFDRNDASGPFVSDSAVPADRGRLFLPSEVWQTLSRPTQRSLPFGRGAVRVVIEGGLIVYGVHAKSEFSGFCSSVSDAQGLLGSLIRRSTNENVVSSEDIEILANAIDALDRLRATEEETSFS